MKLIKFLSLASLALTAGSASLLPQSSAWNTTVTPSEWNSAPNWVGNTIRRRIRKHSGFQSVGHHGGHHGKPDGQPHDR
jgi:hypothetical protein